MAQRPQSQSMGRPPRGRSEEPRSSRAEGYQRNRALSLPSRLPFSVPRKSILQVKTLEESLHSTWESTNYHRGPKRVAWNEVRIREFARIVGDNPSCSSGPPLTIGWEHTPTPFVQPIELYESDRPPRKSQFEMVLPREDRQDLLMDEWKISQTEIVAAVRANMKIKNQRRRTVNNLGKMTKVEEAMESAQRKFFRVVKFQKSTSRQVEDMTKQSMKAKAQRDKIIAQYSDIDPSVSTETSRNSSRASVTRSPRSQDNGLAPQQKVPRGREQAHRSTSPKQSRPAPANDPLESWSRRQLPPQAPMVVENPSSSLQNANTENFLDGAETQIQTTEFDTEADRAFDAEFGDDSVVHPPQPVPVRRGEERRYQPAMPPPHHVQQLPQSAYPMQPSMPPTQSGRPQPMPGLNGFPPPAMAPNGVPGSDEAPPKKKKKKKKKGSKSPVDVTRSAEDMSVSKDTRASSDAASYSVGASSSGGGSSLQRPMGPTSEADQMRMQQVFGQRDGVM